MTVPQVKAIVGPIEVGWHRAYEVSIVLLAVGLAEFYPGYLGDRIGLVGRLQLTSEKVFLLHRLRSELGVDTRASQEQKLLCSVTVSGVYYVKLYREVLTQEVRRIRRVCQNPPDLGCSMEDVFRFLCRKEVVHRSGVGQVELRVGAGDEVLEALPFETLQER